MKTMITVITIMLCLQLSAPPNNSVVVIASEGISFYEPLIKAVTMVESRDGKYLYNPKENAVGWFQIRQIRVDHYNQLRGTNYILADFYDYNLSREMYLYFAAGKSYENAAKDWNGTGPMTIDYWHKIQKHLN